jgi:two-component system OmpR family sensor kinase
MFRSIRWRLVASYVLLSLVTLFVVGILTWTLLRQYINQQEKAFLQSNAEAVAQQALPLMWPIQRISDLQELVDTAAFLGDIRVKILGNNNHLLVDSGSIRGTGRNIWVVVPGFEFSESIRETFIFPLPSDFMREFPLEAEHFEFLENLPEEARVRQVQRVFHPWGVEVIFESTPDVEIVEFSTRSDRVVLVPIGERDDTVGLVEVSGGSNFGEEAIETIIRLFLFAAAGTIILAVLVGLWVSRRLTAPLTQLSDVAGQMSKEDLSVRVPSFGRDEIGRLARQFNDMADKLETSFKKLASERDTLRRFIADASHELRSPVTALRNFNELLQDKASEDPDIRTEFLKESEVQIDRLEWVTENLLNLSRLDAGLVKLNRVSHNVIDLLEETVAPYRIQAQEKDITLRIKPVDPQVEICVDRTLMMIALSNLFENAIKFAPAASGLVEFGAEQGSEGFQFWVKDNGPGIDAGDLPHIFERFYRGQGVEMGGSGLGLAMVKSVVEAHEGRVFVESEPGEGSLFVIELPHAESGDENQGLSTNGG